MGWSAAVVMRSTSWRYPVGVGTRAASPPQGLKRMSTPVVCGDVRICALNARHWSLVVDIPTDGHARSMYFTFADCPGTGGCATTRHVEAGVQPKLAPAVA